MTQDTLQGFKKRSTLRRAVLTRSESPTVTNRGCVLFIVTHCGCVQIIWGILNNINNVLLHLFVFFASNCQYMSLCSVLTHSDCVKATVASSNPYSMLSFTRGASDLPTIPPMYPVIYTQDAGHTTHHNTHHCVSNRQDVSQIFSKTTYFQSLDRVATLIRFKSNEHRAFCAQIYKDRKLITCLYWSTLVMAH